MLPLTLCSHGQWHALPRVGNRLLERSPLTLSPNPDPYSLTLPLPPPPLLILLVTLPPPLTRLPKPSNADNEEAEDEAAPPT